jgi:hypothetical protein
MGLCIERTHMIMKGSIFFPLKVNRRFGEIYHLRFQGLRIGQAINQQVENSEMLAYLSTVKMKVTCCSY